MIKEIRFIVAFCIIFLVSCKEHVRNEVQVYANNFESGDLSAIQSGAIAQFNNSAVLGRYNNGNFALTVNNLPEHDLITISFDLYIHDKWDGNRMAPDGPDIWEMLVDGNTYINTTFSNDICPGGGGVFCPPQAYPADYPNSNHNPKTGAFRTDLPGACSNSSSPNGTTEYKIEKTFRHTNKTLVLQCLDKLIQPNAADPKCDESWSVDNIVVKAITL
ncbi:MAG: hypothetical protein V5804_12415 [Mucilaginibacter sp.]|uniref:hypothetical protein n=1 Tax=Mucilaginibacter sp. TaxID=1882438 RepID=UPI0034E46AED